MSPEKRKERIASTHEAALAFVEDMESLRAIASKDSISHSEIRWLSVILRRLLVEQVIQKIASPRMSHITILAPDNAPVYNASRKHGLAFFMSGRAKIFGWDGSIYAFELAPGNAVAIPQDYLHNSVSLPPRNFISQNVLCWRGQWINRGAIIEYVANVCSGVHSGAPKSEIDKLLAQVRSANRIVLRDGGIHLDLFANGLDSDITTFRYTPDAIDPTLVELLAASQFLSRSPDVLALEAIVRKERGDP